MRILKWILAMKLVIIYNVCGSYHSSKLPATYFILANGTNTPNCGTRKAEACASFPYVLSIIRDKYNITDLPEMKILTNIAVTIDNSILKDFSWLSGLSLVVKDVDDSGGNASLNLQSVALTNTSHRAVNINVNITASNLINYQLKYDDHSSRDSLRPTKFTKQLSVKDSFISAVKAKPNHFTLLSVSGQAVFTNVTINGISQPDSIVKAAKGSSLELDRCNISNNSIHFDYGVIFLHSASISMLDCSFVENNSLNGNGAVIYATRYAEIRITRCAFTKNYAFWSGGVIYATNNVLMNIFDSTFSHNEAFHKGGVIYSEVNTTSYISSSNFTGNKAGLSDGGCINMNNRSDFTIHNSLFDRNKAGNEGGVIYTSDNSNLNIYNTDFVNNKAGVKTGVLSLNNYGKTHCEHCTFVNNTGILTQSVISANVNASLTLKQCLFDSNPSSFTGLLEAGDGTDVKIMNSTFTRNSAVVGSLIEITDSTLAVDDSTFAENTGGSLIYGHNSAHILFERCTFANHSLAADPIMVISDCHIHLKNSTFFNNSQHKEGGIVIGKSNAVVNVTSSSFIGNQASKGAAFYISRESALYVDNSVFLNNSAGDGGVLYILDSLASIKNSVVRNSTGTGYGGVCKGLNAKITVRNCSFTSNRAFFGGVFYLMVNTSLAAYETIFEYGHARQGGAIYKNGPGNVTLENSTLVNNTGEFGGAIYAQHFNYLRLAQSICIYIYETYLKRDCLTMECTKSRTGCQLYTYNFSISNGVLGLNSMNNPMFFKVAKNEGMIYTKKEGNPWLETLFASLRPLPCGHQCKCYYIQDKGNIVNCSSSRRKTLPDANDVPNVTNWLDVSGNNLTELCGSQHYLRKISALYAQNSNISNICNDTVTSLIKGRVKILQLTDNKFRHLPKYIQNVTTLTEVWLSRNPFDCNCKMLWMRDWMNNFNKSGDRVVQDYFEITCKNGFPIHALDAVEMGCFPMELTLWEKGLIGISAAVVFFIVIAIIAISKRWNEVKWFMYLHFGYLDKNDGLEDLTNIEKDVLISYSEEDSDLMREMFMADDGETVLLERDEKMQVLLHERDFVAGRSITTNIERAVKSTRRMIMLLSRNYVISRYCLAEFQLAHHRMLNGDKKYLIPILLEPLNVKNLSEDLQMYMRTYTYIDYTKHPRDLKMLRKRIMFAMPRIPLSKRNNLDPDQQQLNGVFDTSTDERTESMHSVGIPGPPDERRPPRNGRAGIGPQPPPERNPLLPGAIAGGPFGTTYASINAH